MSDGMRLNEKEEWGHSTIINYRGFKEMKHFFMERATLQFLSIQSIPSITKEKINFSSLIDSIDFLKRN